MTVPTSNSGISITRWIASAAYRSRRRLATAAAMMFAVLLGYYAVAGDNGIQVYKQKRLEDRQLAKQIEDLKQENSQLQAHIERLQSDPDAIEHEAREKLHYARPGEVIYTLRDTPEGDRVAGAGQGPTSSAPPSASGQAAPTSSVTR